MTDTPDRTSDRQSDVAPVRAFWEELGLPGLFDVHVHFLPPNIQKAVWHVFDTAGPKIGQSWPIRYRQSHEERVELLRAMGVRRFSTLPYAHKPGVAAYLNDWSRTFAADDPRGALVGHVLPRGGRDGVRRRAGVRAGVELFKLHQQVGEFHLDDPLLDDVWGLLSEAGVPILVHAGSMPVGNDFTGPESLQRLLERHPRLPIIVAHMGAPEVVRFLRLAEGYERRAAGHDDGLHRLRDALPRLAGAAAGRPAAQDPARHRLPDHPLPYVAPARGPGPASTSATTGCARSAGRTASRCSAPADDVERCLATLPGWTRIPLR